MSIWENLDKAEVAKNEFTLIPEGEYKATVTNVNVEETAFPFESTKITVEFTLTEGDFTGRKCFWSSNLSEQSTPKALSFVKSQICRLAGVESTNGDPLGVLTGCHGKDCTISIQHRPGIKDPNKTYLNVFIQ